MEYNVLVKKLRKTNYIIKFDSLLIVVKSMHWRPTEKNINCKVRMCKMFGTVEQQNEKLI